MTTRIDVLKDLILTATELEKARELLKDLGHVIRSAECFDACDLIVDYFTKYPDKGDEKMHKKTIADDYFGEQAWNQAGNQVSNKFSDQAWDHVSDKVWDADCFTKYPDKGDEGDNHE